MTFHHYKKALFCNWFAEKVTLTSDLCKFTSWRNENNTWSLDSALVYCSRRIAQTCNWLTNGKKTEQALTASSCLFPGYKWLKLFASLSTDKWVIHRTFVLGQSLSLFFPLLSVSQFLYSCLMSVWWGVRGVITEKKKHHQQSNVTKHSWLFMHRRTISMLKQNTAQGCLDHY